MLGPLRLVGRWVLSALAAEQGAPELGVPLLFQPSELGDALGVTVDGVELAGAAPAGGLGLVAVGMLRRDVVGVVGGRDSVLRLRVPGAELNGGDVVELSVGQLAQLLTTRRALPLLTDHHVELHRDRNRLAKPLGRAHHCFGCLHLHLLA